MNYKITAFVLWMCCLSVTVFGKVCSETASSKTSYTLQTQCKPAYSGSTNRTTPEERQPGTSYYVEATAQAGFEFLYWEENGNVVSMAPYFYYTMPEHDVVLTARFKFNPDSPANPLTNYYDAETKTLYMDDFKPGEYYSTLTPIAYPLSNDDLEMLVVTGEMTSNDLCDVNYRKPLVVDLSRVTGVSVINYIGDYNEYLHTLILPECVETLGNGAFWQLENIVSLTLNAFIPPTVSDDLPEYLDPQKVTVYVPGVSLGIYMQHSVWGQYQLRPITGEVYNITVSLPKGSKADDYQNCYIDLVNAKNGLKLSCLVSDTTDFVFSNIAKKTVWNAYLRSSRDKELSRINDIRVEDEDVHVWFSSDTNSLSTLTVSVEDEEGKDLTSDCRIRFFDEHGRFLKEDFELTGLVWGEKVEVEAVLPDYLALTYKPIERTMHEVLVGSNHIVLVAKYYEKSCLNVQVFDEDTHKPLQGVFLSVFQQIEPMLPDAVSKEVTEAGGSATLDVYSGFDMMLYARADGYVRHEEAIGAISVGKDRYVTIELKKETVSNTALHLTIQAALDAYEGEEQQVKTATENDYGYFQFQIFNKTKQQPITEFKCSASTIYLSESADEGDVLSVMATVTDDCRFVKAAPVSAEGTVVGNAANIMICFTEYGTFDATLSGGKQSLSYYGTLYDSGGRKVCSERYSSQKLPGMMRQRLVDGSYTLVTTIRQSGPGELALLETRKLGEDYTQNVFSVNSGHIIKVLAKAPTGSDSIPDPLLVFSTKKKEYKLGDFVTLTTVFEFLGEEADKVSNVRLVFDLQENNHLIANTVLVDKQTIPSVSQGNRLTMSMDANSATVSLCTSPSQLGRYTPTATLHFSYDGEEYQKSMTTEFEVLDDGKISFHVPEKTDTKEIRVHGIAPGCSTVRIFDGNIPIGSITARVDGEWSTSVSLVGEERWHYIHIEVSSISFLPGVTYVSGSKVVEYDPTINIPGELSFSFYNRYLRQTVIVTYDDQNCTKTVNSYMFYTTAEFTFTAKFLRDEPETISTVVINVWMENGSVLPLKATYNAVLHQYVATSTFEWGNLPVNLSIDYAYKGETLIVDHTYTATTPCAKNVTPIHDPSGYVYEAVGSNRVEGVTATIYYKETVEDEYGDPVERIVLWDAENFGQENPLYTDEKGVYQWDVPRGQWQVKFEKTGYETTLTDWLPVPPPQLEVNIPMMQLTQPVVRQVKAYDDMVEIAFDKYMVPSTLHVGNIFITVDEEALSGTIELVDEETVSKTDATTYASRLRFLPDNPQLLSGKKELTVIIDKRVEAYNHLTMAQIFRQTFAIEHRLKSIEVVPSVEIVSGDEASVSIACFPSDAAAGKTIIVSSASDIIASVGNAGQPLQLQLNNKGKASVRIKGILPGQTVVTCAIADTGIQSEVDVRVISEAEVNGIEDMCAPCDIRQKGVYSLQGVRIGHPLVKGLYIRDGKKYVTR